jgi:hypothetical protein
MLDLLHNYIMPNFVVQSEFHYALPKQILQDLFHTTLHIQNVRLVSHLQHTFKCFSVVCISLCFAHIKCMKFHKSETCNVV